ncbi:hypothetical protein [Kordia sp.]|uniref:hypothetical protein n=1 Tax=Kordia sp. TaxID=1965332 RepID=UPI0025BA9ACA|nr:hypothetical protein [Kordia sp.]MCH2195588.1 hypothetical protein [Kordia sp.]
MKKHLYFICPTDHLEAVINDVSKSENYYITSLGNSIVFDKDTIDEISVLIARKDIDEITFVLSDTNKIILDALDHENFTNIRGLNILYDEMKKQKEYKQIIWGNRDLRTPILSYHLNQKVYELISKLHHWNLDILKVNAKIYNKQDDIFNDVFSDLIYEKHFSLN